MKPQAWALLQYDRTLRENRLVGIYLDPDLASRDALLLETEKTGVTIEPYDITTESIFGTPGPIDETTATTFDTGLHVR